MGAMGAFPHRPPLHPQRAQPKRDFIIAVSDFENSPFSLLSQAPNFHWQRPIGVTK